MQINAIAVSVMLCGALTAGIGVYAWRRRSTAGARAFALFMFLMTVYILGYSLELSSRDLAAMLLWSKVQYVGILTFPTCYLIFIIQYTGGAGWLTRRNLALLFALPALFLAAKLFDDRLRLIYAGTSLDVSGVIPLLAFERGPLYPVIVAYNLAVVTMGNYLLIQKRRFGSTLYRRQTLIILVVAILIYGIYGLYLSGVTLFPALPGLDLNPFAYTLWGLAIGWAIFRHRLFDLAPIARDALIENLADGVVVLDAQGRLVDANPVAQRLFDWSSLPVGQPAERLLADGLAPAIQGTAAGSTRLETPLTPAGAAAHYEVTISALRDPRGRRVGHLLVAHDISERKAIERELHELSLADELTGLTNRRGLRMLAGQMLSMCQRMQLGAALFYIDLDRLKWINDTLGHAAGDLALIDVSQILKNTFRASDIVARLGGDEFVVLALESADNSAGVMQARLLAGLAAHNAQARRGYRLEFSLGLARFDWERPAALDALLAAADQAMYVDKQARRAQAG